MKAESNYQYADTVIKKLKKRIPRLLNDTRLRLTAFDEINSLFLKKLLEDAYEEIESQATYAYLNIAERTYREAFDLAKQLGYESGTYNPIWLGIITDWLLEYDLTTGYMFENEFKRKRDRLFERLMGVFISKKSINDPLTMLIYKKAGKYISDQIAEYGDIITYKAMLKAYRDAGVKKVIWFSEHDNRVCDVCLNLSEQEFDIDDVPAKPHWGCRCWLLPLRTEKS